MAGYELPSGSSFGGVRCYLTQGNESSPEEVMPLSEFPDHCCRAEHKPSWVNRITGEITRPVCKAPSLCSYCASVARLQAMGAVGASQPTAMLTFTAVGAVWMKIKFRVNKVIEHIRRDRYRLDWVWKVECSSQPSSEPDTDGPAIGRWLEESHAGHGHHVHALAHGEFPLDEAYFSAQAQRVGFGFNANLQAPLNSSVDAAAYLWGREKFFEIHPLNHGHHMAVNGGRLWHASHDFWRFDGSTMPRHEVIKKVNAAYRRGLTTTGLG